TAALGAKLTVIEYQPRSRKADWEATAPTTALYMPGLLTLKETCPGPLMVATTPEALVAAKVRLASRSDQPRSAREIVTVPGPETWKLVTVASEPSTSGVVTRSCSARAAVLTRLAAASTRARASA